MSKYNKEQLRDVFQRPFDKETWKTILIDIFRANNVRVEPEKFTDPGQSETGWYMGNIETPDNYRIGLFFYHINSGSVAHKKVGLRNLVKSWVNPNWGEFDAAIVVFSDSKDWRLSVVCDIKDVATAPKRFTYVFGEKDNLYRTPVERFTILQNEEPSFKNIRKAFSVEALSDDFFGQYRDYYADFVEFITGKRYVKEGTKWVERETHKPNYQYSDTFGCDDKLVRDYIKKMFGRIVFLYFLQRKGWLDGNRNYMHDLFVSSDKKDDFLDGVLEPLFFEILNTDKPYRTAAAKALPGHDNIPYLNGGLFAVDDIDRLDCKFPESLFSKFFDFLDSYNFTIDENDANDAEIGIDPEMLGRIFENLLEDNKDKGAFYTPKEIVDYMCRESLIAYATQFFPEGRYNSIRKFIETLDASEISEAEKFELRKRLQAVKICDPAIGSGAFPMGLVNLLSKLYVAMKPDTDTSVMKRYIMEQNIYGVDIEKGAVDIARLRFWLAMIVEEKKEIPLPNLHFKIMQGNSLLESYQGKSLEDLTEVEVQQEDGTIDFDFVTAEQKDLVSSLSSYYGTSDHNKRDRLFDSIIQNVRRQINDKNISLPSDFDPSANDKFFLWHTWFKDVFDNGGFDIVIGNPPYLKEGRVSKSIFEQIKISPYYQGKMDIWYMFACIGIDMLKECGNLCFIATNNWTTSAGASKLRNKVMRDTQILKFCDFCDYMIFETASIQTMIMQFKKNRSIDNYNFDLCKLRGSTLDDVIKLLAKKPGTYAEFIMPRIERNCYVNKYLTFSLFDTLLNKIAKHPEAIFLRADEMTNGIHPHYDFVNRRLSEKFDIRNGAGIFGLTSKELEDLALNEAELALIKPYYNSGDAISRYYIKDTDLSIIYTDSSFKRLDSMNSYPHLKIHLDKYGNVISSDNKPYGLHRAREEKFFLGEKIAVLRKCSGKPVFAYGRGRHYMSATFYVIKTGRVGMRFLTGLLNSKLIEFWLRSRGKMQGANFQLDKAPLMEIPIVVASNAIQEKISSLVDDIIREAKSHNSGRGIAEQSKTNQIFTNNDGVFLIQNRIDLMIYHLYGLNYDEVLVVDPNTSITRAEYEIYE